MNPKPDTQPLHLNAQQVLDELRAEHLIPFKLTAQSVDEIGLEEYIVTFTDSVQPIGVSLLRGDTFEEAFRSSLLARVLRTMVHEQTISKDLSKALTA